MSPLDKIHGDTSQNLMQSRIDQALQPGPGAIQEGLLIPDIVLASGTARQIAHRLGRIPVGAFYVKASNGANFEIGGFTADFLTVKASANGTYSFWVF